MALFVFYHDFPPSDPQIAIARDREFAYFIVHYLPTGVLGLVVAAVFTRQQYGVALGVVERLGRDDGQ